MVYCKINHLHKKEGQRQTMKYEDNFHSIIKDHELFEALLKERDSIGYYNLIHQDTSKFKAYAETVKQSNIVIIGIGGSTLGTSAIYDFLKHSKKLSKQLIFLETTDPLDVNAKLNSLNLEDTLFIVISKSGTTVETISIFKYLHTLTAIDKNNCLIITEHDSKLNTYAKKHDIQTFEIPKNVGGRFSVFSSVGLVPLAIVGIDIDTLLHGAKNIHDSFFNQETYYNRLLNKARFLIQYKYQFNINIIFSYSSMLEGFNKWYIQLWGESLGKRDIDNVEQGLTPLALTGPVDQHSFLQLIIEGRKDKTITFIKVDDFQSSLSIPDVTLEGLEELDYLNNIRFSELINLQADATIEALADMKRIPCDIIYIKTICEESIAKLMYEYELLTSICAKLLYINAYDQPGVEKGKIILKNKLKHIKER